LGEMPSHWNLSSIKFLAKIQNGSTPSSSNDEYWNGDVNWVTTDDLGKLVNKEITETRRTITKLGYESCGTSLAPIDSIVMSTRAPIGHIGILKIEASTNQGCKTIIPLKVNSLFCYYYFLNTKEVLQSLGQGSTFKELPTSTLKDFKIVFPSSMEEQTAIANYLDHKTSQIDHLIAKKEQFIKLLEEERVAVINQAVTKGLDPNVPMKDSGVEWLGEIPKHWEVKRIKYIANLKSGNNIVSEQITSEGKYPVYGGNGQRGYFSDYTNDGNFVLIGRQGALCGNINFATNKFWASEHAIVCYLEVNNNWLWFGKLLDSMNLNQYNQSAAQPGLAVGVIKNLYIPYPNFDEQNMIFEFINNYEFRTEKLIQKTRLEIELLKEYKTALISEVVTGKVDVRNEKLN
jgi:type I restriction enzyme S subunit